LSADKAEVERLDKRSRALQTSCDSFTILQTEIAALTRILNDLEAELSKEDDEARSAVRHREALQEKTNNVRDVETKEKILRKQLEHLQSRTQKLRDDAETKADNAKKQMAELKSSHRELNARRQERGEEVERRRIRIEQTGKKVRMSSSSVISTSSQLTSYRWPTYERISSTRSRVHEKST